MSKGVLRKNQHHLHAVFLFDWPTFPFLKPKVGHAGQNMLSVLQTVHSLQQSTPFGLSIC